MSERDGPRTLADREQSRHAERRDLDREFAAFLEVLYRALMVVARWIEKRRMKR